MFLKRIPFFAFCKNKKKQTKKLSVCSKTNSFLGLAQRKGFEAKTLSLKALISKGFRLYCPNTDPQIIFKTEVCLIR